MVLVGHPNSNRALLLAAEIKGVKLGTIIGGEIIWLA
jgi:hypothetical protein